MKKIIFLVFILLISGLNSYSQMRIDTSAIVKNNPNIYSIVVAQNNKTIYNKYFNGKDSTLLFNDQSLTKSIGALLIGIAIEKGYISSVDEKISVFFPELKTDSDKRKQDITIRQIMNQASGFYHETLENLSSFFAISNPSAHVLKAPLVSEPGKIFHYNNAATHLLSVILTKSTGMDTRTFAKKFLFDPLGITTFDWKKMRDGYYDGSGLESIRLRSVDMLKIGNLVLNKGMYGQRQIITAKWISMIIDPKITYQTRWGFDNSLYSGCWYHADYKGTRLTYGLGWGGQFLVIIPSLKVVVVANSSIADATAIQQEEIFMHQIFPIILEQVKDHMPK